MIFDAQFRDRLALRKTRDSWDASIYHVRGAYQESLEGLTNSVVVLDVKNYLLK